MSLDYSSITVNIPAYNEAKRIGKTIYEIKKHFPNILVIDDNSHDKTKEVAEIHGAEVIDNQYEKGYIGATKTGFRNVETEWIATIDADGEHRVDDLVSICKYKKIDTSDLIMGTRPLIKISRPSEIIIDIIARIKSPVFDTGTGLRLIKTKIASKMILNSKCPCGTFVVEAIGLGAKVLGVPISLNNIHKRRRIMWEHIPQLFILATMLFKNPRNGNYA